MFKALRNWTDSKKCTPIEDLKSVENVEKWHCKFGKVDRMFSYILEEIQSLPGLNIQGSQITFSFTILMVYKLQIRRFVNTQVFLYIHFLNLKAKISKRFNDLSNFHDFSRPGKSNLQIPKHCMIYHQEPWYRKIHFHKTHIFRGKQKNTENTIL